MVDQPSASLDELLDQQRAPADFRGFVLKAESLDDILWLQIS
jgi:hypothetical protein